MKDPRAKHLWRLRHLHRAARFWTVVGGTLVGATVVLLPYQGVGLADAFWAAGAGGSAAIAWWRWRDFKAHAALPTPEPLDDAVRAAHKVRKLEAVVSALPIGRTAVDEMHRLRYMSRLHGSAAADAGGRLDRAARSLAGIAGSLDNEVLLEARAAERGLRDLAERTAGIERVLRLPEKSAGPRDQLGAAHAEMVTRLDEGVTAYEGFVTAAASVVAENGLLADPTAAGRLTEASDRLRGMAEALAEFTRGAVRRQQA
ncbi:MAG TPA: hypothetical protein VFR11_03885 [Micromonosporaceae bacterium]|nr:hypothetical protein [Micromonosporaceae bacterium]